MKRIVAIILLALMGGIAFSWTALSECISPTPIDEVTMVGVNSFRGQESPMPEIVAGVSVFLNLGPVILPSSSPISEAHRKLLKC